MESLHEPCGQRFLDTNYQRLLSAQVTEANVSASSFSMLDRYVWQ